MEKSKKQSNLGYKLATIFSILILMGTLVVLNPFGVSATNETLNVSISPEGVKLSPGNNQIFVASVEGGNPDFMYQWSVNNTKVEGVLETDFYSCVVNGPELDFVFLQVCDYVLLDVEVTDSSKNVGFASTIVYDPFTARNIYLEDLPSTYDRVIRFDGSYYSATKGDGDIDYNGTDRDTAVQDSLTDLTTSGGTICLVDVVFNSSSLTVPDDVTVYEVLNNGTKCFINSADTQGSPYTISTDGTNYFAQDSGNRYIVSWESTNTTALWDNVLGSCSGGETITFTSNNYTISSALTDGGKNDITIDCSGSWFVLADSSDINLFDISSVSGWNIKNFKIDGNKAGQSSLGDGIRLTSVTNSYIQNGEIIDCYLEGIRLQTSSNNFITGLILTNNDNDGLLLNTNSDNNKISKITASYNGDYGILIYMTSNNNEVTQYEVFNNTLSGFGLFGGADANTVSFGNSYNNTVHGLIISGESDSPSINNIISNNHFFSNTEYGVMVTGAGGRSNYNQVTNNFVYSNTLDGIKIDRSDFVTVNDNEVFENLNTGISVYSCTNAVVDGNRVYDNGATGVWEADWVGIEFNGASYSNVLNNICFDDDAGVQKEGFYERGGTSDYNRIINNDFRNNTVRAVVSLVGENTELRGNKGYNIATLISNPITTGETVLVDAGGNDTLANSTTYTISQSPKTIYMQDADTFDVYHNGQLVANDVNQYVLVVYPLETFKIDWVSSLTILKVMME